MRFATLQVAMSLVFTFSTDSTPLLVLGGAAGLTGIAMGMWTVPGNSASRGVRLPGKDSRSPAPSPAETQAGR